MSKTYSPIISYTKSHHKHNSITHTALTYQYEQTQESQVMLNREENKITITLTINDSHNSKHF